MESEKKPSKWLSTKLWITIFACGLLSFIVIADRQAFMSVANICAGVIPVYLGVNVAQKKIFADKENE